MWIVCSNGELVNADFMDRIYASPRCDTDNPANANVVYYLRFRKDGNTAAAIHFLDKEIALAVQAAIVEGLASNQRIVRISTVLAEYTRDYPATPAVPQEGDGLRRIDLSELGES